MQRKHMHMDLPFKPMQVQELWKIFYADQQNGVVSGDVTQKQKALYDYFCNKAVAFDYNKVYSHENDAVARFYSKLISNKVVGQNNPYYNNDNLKEKTELENFQAGSYWRGEYVKSEGAFRCGFSVFPREPRIYEGFYFEGEFLFGRQLTVHNGQVHELWINNIQKAVAQ